MSSNNSTVDVSCPNLYWYTKLGGQASFIDKYISSPINIMVGLFMHGIFLKAFYTQVKKENGYAYQIIVTISDILATFSYWVYLIFFQFLADPNSNGPLWYRTCYSCMFFSKIAGSSLLSIFYTATIFFTISMSADRLYALWKPLSYKIANTKRNVILSLSFSATFAVLINLTYFFHFTVEQTGEHSGHLAVYALIYNQNGLIQIFTTFRTFIQTFCIPILYFSNIALVRLYRIRKIEAARALNMTSNEKQARRVQKTLTLLSICQCIWITLQITSTSAVQIAMYLFPSSYRCSGLLYRPLREILLHILYVANLFTVPIISKQFRKMLYEEFPCYKKEGTVAGAGTASRLRQPARQVW